MSIERDKARFKSKLHETARTFQASLTAGSPAYAGAEIDEALEYATRQHVIDLYLTALGWQLNNHEHDIIEEARAKGRTTLFLDYLGVNPESRTPLLIVEAKAWDKPFISPSTATVSGAGANNSKDSYASLIARTVEHVKDGGTEDTSPVSVEWMRWIKKLCDYVQTVYNTSGHCVKCVAITSGQWFIIFTDPDAILLQKSKVIVSSILCFQGEELIDRSDEIFDHLARKSLIRDPPELLRPPQLKAYVAAPDLAKMFHALWIVRGEAGAHFDVQPRISVYAALIIQRRDGVLITTVDDHNRLDMPHEKARLAGHISGVSRSAGELLQTVNQELNATIVPSGIEQFPGFGRSLTGAAAINVLTPALQTQTGLLKPWRKPDEFLLVTGTNPHFLHERPIIENCRFHDWSVCHGIAQHQGDGPIMARSVEPSSFFFSTEDHHCAHREVHYRRHERCQIDAFEEFLCCRACTLQTYCWSSAETARLPCGLNA